MVHLRRGLLPAEDAEHLLAITTEQPDTAGSDKSSDLLNIKAH
jgi:hypothetical protein